MPKDMPEDRPKDMPEDMPDDRSEDQCWESFQIMLPSEYRVPSNCNRLTSNYNLFLIFIVEQDTDTKVNLKKNPHDE